ncbi:hypothetical protein A1Q1_02598 [Trichosporon asahii var. asahii CBS 2479]|uniref:Uncharacterized protein n=1 Tax=Trichosporon asahii var. asahii (strain ATCC 90039 / CBS 2479 / JCM 2466 / KCTC 7840 / NBRC 103889/ NCYC 2677 / UAMH 7654) TaxID=1186058 RepID=J4UBP8_TRIAS|nr:hypothetical protein A1Q1_02598 [Trichosporon asahii var. asahii CBS 2479]EJT48315.1 hypothetical protein A1Q1_02598 [Trichosporon asahii var. asahii CBS 2479]
MSSVLPNTASPALITTPLHSPSKARRTCFNLEIQTTPGMRTCRSEIPTTVRPSHVRVLVLCLMLAGESATDVLTHPMKPFSVITILRSFIPLHPFFRSLVTSSSTTNVPASGALAHTSSANAHHAMSSQNVNISYWPSRSGDDSSQELLKEDTQVGAPIHYPHVDHHHHDVTSGRRTDPIDFIALGAVANRRSKECHRRCLSSSISTSATLHGVPLYSFLPRACRAALESTESLLPLLWNRGHSLASFWHGLRSRNTALNKLK